jgi:uncharacterized protein (TIGR02996 family)
MIATTHPTAPLLAAVLDRPADDGLRLVYADWLDENGEHERAELVRVQIELAKRGNREVDTNQPGIGIKHTCKCGKAQICDKCIALRKREGTLLDELVAEDMAAYFGLPAHSTIHPIGTGLVCPALDVALTFRRGFVERVKCPLAAFLQHAEALFRSQPVMRVRLVDREPWCFQEGSHHWYDTARPHEGVHPQSDLPTELWELLDDASFVDKRRARMKVYRTSNAAVTALSAACVALGRARAGLRARRPDRPAAERRGT